MLTRAVWTGFLLLTALTCAGLAWSFVSHAKDAPASEHIGTSADDLQRALLNDNVGRAGDAKLSAMFVDIAAQHFPGQLAPVPVRWEPGLADVGALDGHAYTLQGMFGAAGSRPLILLNPAIQGDPATVVRALCHEMVHAYLHATGDDSTTHGPPFQRVLRRLSEEGAFEAVAADPEERQRVRAWLDRESARLEAERSALADLDDHIRAERFNRDLEHFRAEVSRYNLMVVYPDGIEGPDSGAAAATGERLLPD